MLLMLLHAYSSSGRIESPVDSQKLVWCGSGRAETARGLVLRCDGELEGA